MAYSHGVFPLVYHALKTYTQLIPNDVLSNMKSHNMKIAQQNMLMSVELIKVMKLLEENNIEAIAFKGPTLAQIAYGDIVLRQYVDLDILIKEKDIFKIANILESINYNTILPLEILNNKLCFNIITDYNFTNITNNISVEFHWRLIEKIFKMNFDSNSLMKNKTSISIQNYNINSFTIEQLIVYLSMHGSKHAWERLEWIIDLEKLIRLHRNKIDWTKVFYFAKSSQSIKALSTLLYMLKEKFDLKLTHSTILEIYKNRKFKELSTLSLQMMIVHSNDSKNLQYKNRRESYRLKMIDKEINIFSYKIESLFKLSKLDCLNIKLPKQFKFLLYIFRLFRLINNLLKK